MIIDGMRTEILFSGYFSFFSWLDNEGDDHGGNVNDDYDDNV